ncbi:hypothetical protein HYD65_04680 [Mycoplasmopsis bovis]|nr:hypothetical protein HYD65_04680 [Mycoplasmopsis bovis]
MKNFGDYEIAKSVSKDLLTDLSNVYPQDMAKPYMLLLYFVL